MLHPLNEEQLSLLNEFKESNLTLKDFAKLKNISLRKISYLVIKERRLKEQEENMSLDSFIPINVNNSKEESFISKRNNKINITINGFNINISINDLKELLK